jgi:hypothetical protein
MTTLQNRPNTALLVVDVQNGVVGGAHERDTVVANIASLVEKARREQVPVVWVQHSDEGLARGSDDWQIVPELAPGDGEPLVEKSYGDSFEDTTLETVLAGLAPGRLVIARAETDACIRSTLHGAWPGATTPHWSATPTRPGTRPPGGRRRRIRSSRTRTCTGRSLFVRGSRVVDVKVEMHLLGGPMRPVGRYMVRRQLHADPPLSSGVDDAVPIVVLEDMPAQHACPERALGIQVGGVKHDHLTHHVHDTHPTEVRGRSGRSPGWVRGHQPSPGRTE